jgi:hypothetical protein
VRLNPAPAIRPVQPSAGSSKQFGSSLTSSLDLFSATISLLAQFSHLDYFRE